MKPTPKPIEREEPVSPVKVKDKPVHGKFVVPLPIWKAEATL